MQNEINLPELLGEGNQLKEETIEAVLESAKAEIKGLQNIEYQEERELAMADIGTALDKLRACNARLKKDVETSNHEEAQPASQEEAEPAGQEEAEPAQA